MVDVIDDKVRCVFKAHTAMKWQEFWDAAVICVVATCSVRATLQRSFPSLVYA